MIIIITKFIEEKRVINKNSDKTSLISSINRIKFIKYS